MSQQDLRELLTQLHTRLSSDASLDAEAREHLTSTLHDIEKALARQNDTMATAAPTPRLEALAVRFEADHPAIAEGVRRLIDLLGKAGI